MRRARRRWKVEQLWAWLHNFRRIVMRFDHHAENYLGFVHLGCIKILLRVFMRPLPRDLRSSDARAESLTLRVRVRRPTGFVALDETSRRIRDRAGGEFVDDMRRKGMTPVPSKAP